MWTDGVYTYEFDKTYRQIYDQEIQIDRVEGERAAERFRVRNIMGLRVRLREEHKRMKANLQTLVKRGEKIQKILVEKYRMEMDSKLIGRIRQIKRKKNHEIGREGRKREDNFM